MINDKTPMPGDFMFTWTEDSLIAAAIAFNTHAKISHVQRVIDVGVNGSIQVVSAGEKGIVAKWVKLVNLDWYAILTCPDWSLKDRDLICEQAWSMIGIPYDFLGLGSFVFNIDMSTEGRLFCSGACFEDCRRAIGYKLFTGIEHQWISPRDIYVHRNLVTLDGSEKEIRSPGMTAEEYTRFKDDWITKHGLNGLPTRSDEA